MYWIKLAVTEPREFAYSAPRRIACRVFGRHNPTCRGLVRGCRAVN